MPGEREVYMDSMSEKYSRSRSPHFRWWQRAGAIVGTAPGIIFTICFAWVLLTAGCWPAIFPLCIALWFTWRLWSK